MLHAQMRCLDELVAVLVPRIGTEPALEALQHWLHLLELLPGGVNVVVERIEIEREPPSLALVDIAEVRVVRGVDGDIVVVDGIDHEPLVSRGAVSVRGLAAQPAVRYVDQGIRHGDGYALTV